jgi:hypothetical protein
MQSGVCSGVSPNRRLHPSMEAPNWLTVGGFLPTAATGCGLTWAPQTRRQVRGSALLKVLAEEGEHPLPCVGGGFFVFTESGDA